MEKSIIKDYVSKQVRFSFGNVFSIPVGTVLLYFFVNYLHIWYIYGSLLSFMFTTVMNFNIQRVLRVIKLKD